MAAGCSAQADDNSLKNCRNLVVYAGHDTEHVVVNSVHAHLSGQCSTHCVVGESEDECSIVDTREVACARGLVLLGLEREGVHVDTHGRDVCVVLVRLDQVEVLALALRETVVAVELHLGGHRGVVAGHTLNAGHGVARLQHGAVEPVGVVEGLLALPGVDGGIIAGHERVALHNPDKLLCGVVEVELDLVGRGCHGLTACELELLDEVLVGDLGEAAALISVEVDVVHVEGGRHEASSGHAVADLVCVGARGCVVPAEVAELVELEPDLHLVVLEGDQGERQARVAAEPELEGDVECVLRGALADLGGCVGLTGTAVIIAVLTTLDEQVHELRHVADHLGITGLLAGLLGELIPDVEPVTVVLIDLLTTDLNIHVVDEVVANPVEPAELGTRTIRGLECHLGECGLEVHTVDQVTVTGDCALHLLAEVGGTVECLFNGLHGAVCVATVYDLEDKVLPSLSGYFGPSLPGVGL